MRTILKEKFLDYFNNYLTVEKYAEDNEITYAEAAWVIRTGRKYHEEDCK